MKDKQQAVILLLAFHFAMAIYSYDNYAWPRLQRVFVTNSTLHNDEWLGVAWVVVTGLVKLGMALGAWKRLGRLGFLSMILLTYAMGIGVIRGADPGVGNITLLWQFVMLVVDTYCASQVPKKSC